MILEVAILDVKAGQAEAFETTFSEAQGIISSMKGYVSHERAALRNLIATYCL